MNYEWDEAKCRRNVAKHGVDFDAIYDFDWDSSVTVEDTRRAYGETRYISLGLIGYRLYACVHTQRGGKQRLISLRKANEKEEIFYEKTAKTSDK